MGTVFSVIWRRWVLTTVKNKRKPNTSMYEKNLPFEMEEESTIDRFSKKDNSVY